METLKQFGLDPEQLIGYFYSALLAMVLLHYIAPDVLIEFHEIFEVDSIYLVAFFVTGILLFVVYFNFFGKRFLYKIYYELHEKQDKRKNTTTSTSGFLRKIGVKEKWITRAYEDVKNAFFDETLKLKILVAHGETHIFYITTSQCMVALLYMLITQLLSYRHFKIELYVITSVFMFLSFISAVLIDVTQHSYETALMEAFFEKGKLKDFLDARGYLKEEPSRDTTLTSGADQTKGVGG